MCCYMIPCQFCNKGQITVPVNKGDIEVECEACGRRWGVNTNVEKDIEIADTSFVKKLKKGDEPWVISRKTKFVRRVEICIPVKRFIECYGEENIFGDFDEAVVSLVYPDVIESQKWIRELFSVWKTSVSRSQVQIMKRIIKDKMGIKIT